MDDRTICLFRYTIVQVVESWLIGRYEHGCDYVYVQSQVGCWQVGPQSKPLLDAAVQIHDQALEVMPRAKTSAFDIVFICAKDATTANQFSVSGPPNRVKPRAENIAPWVTYPTTRDMNRPAPRLAIPTFLHDWETRDFAM